MIYRSECTPNYFNEKSKNYFPEAMGITITEASQSYMMGEMMIVKGLFAPNQYLHAGSIVSLADTVAGYACIAHLPQGGKTFTTIELKTNFIATAKEGKICCEARPAHMGKTTHVWDVNIWHQSTQKQMALFRCTQLIIY